MGIITKLKNVRLIITEDDIADGYIQLCLFAA